MRGHLAHAHRLHHPTAFLCAILVSTSFRTVNRTLDSQPLGTQGDIALGAKGVVQGPCSNPGLKDRDLRMEVAFEKVRETYNLLPEQVSKNLADANLPAGFECVCTIA